MRALPQRAGQRPGAGQPQLAGAGARAQAPDRLGQRQRVLPRLEVADLHDQRAGRLAETERRRRDVAVAGRERRRCRRRRRARAADTGRRTRRGAARASSSETTTQAAAASSTRSLSRRTRADERAFSTSCPCTTTTSGARPARPGGRSRPAARAGGRARRPAAGAAPRPARGGSSEAYLRRVRRPPDRERGRPDELDVRAEPPQGLRLALDEDAELRVGRRRPHPRDDEHPHAA